MTLHQDFRRTAAAVVAGLALTLGAGAAVAQPMGGPHGPGAGEEMIGHLIAHAKAQLNLDSGQQAQFDAAVAASKAARESARALRQTVKDALQKELANPVPNLSAVATIADGVQQQASVLHRQVRDTWLQFYNNVLHDDQKAIVRDLLQKRLARAESFRQKMLERMQQRFGTGG
jgi:hypothetical protein